MLTVYGRLKGVDNLYALEEMKVNDKFRMKSYTKLMENLEVRDENDKTQQIQAQHADEICVVSDADHCDIVVVNSYQQGAVAYYFAEKNGSYDSVFIPLSGKCMTAGLDRDGRVYVYAIRDEKVFFSCECRPHGGNYSEEQEVDITYPKDFGKLERIMVKDLKDGHALFVICSSKDNNISYAACRIWDEKYDYMLPVAFSKGEFAVSGETKEELAVHLIADQYVHYGIKERSMEIMPVHFSSDDVTIKQLIYEDGLFCLYTDNTADTVYQEVFAALLQEEGQLHAQIISEMPSCRSAAIRCREDKYHYALLDDDLMHSSSKKDFIAAVPCPIDAKVSAVSFSKRVGEITLYYFQSEKNAVVRLDYISKTGQWSELQLDFLKPGEIRRMPCYSTEVTILHPEYNCPMVDIAVELWTEERTYLETKKGLSLCDAEHKIVLSTGGDGKIYFVQYTNKIDASPVMISFSQDLMDEEDVVTCIQYEAALGKFENIKASDILEAKTTDSMGTGQMDFLSGKFRTEENAKNLAENINCLMGMMPNKINMNPANKGMYIVKRSETAALGQLTDANHDVSWSLDVDPVSGKICFSRLTGEEAAAQIRQMKQEVQAENGFFSDLADFFRAVGKKIAQVVKIVVNGIWGTVSCIVNGVKMIFEGIINTVTAVINFIETVFSVVAIFFIVIFMWVASLFQWNDVKRTQRAISGMFGIMMKKLPEKSDAIKDQLIVFLGGVKADLDKLIDTACQEIAPDTSIIKYAADIAEEKENYEMEEVISNDVLGRKLSGIQSTGVCLMTASDVRAYQEDLKPLMDAIKSFSGSIENTQAFEEASDYITQAFSDLDGMFGNLFAAMLKVLQGLMDAILSGIGGVVSIFFQMINTILRILDSCMNKRINIPFFSELYKQMTGDDLTFMNISSFILAVPTTIVYKFIYGKAPIESEEALERFLADYEAVMEHDWTGADRNCKEDWITPEIVHALTSIVGLISSSFYNCFGMELDVETMNKMPASNMCNDEEKEETVVDVFVQIMEWVWFGASAPWAHKTDEKQEITAVDIIAWGYFGFGCLVDTVFLVCTKSYIDKGEKEGRIVTCIYGLGHLVINIVRWCGEGFDLSYIAEMAGAVAEMTKILINYVHKYKWCKWSVIAMDAIATFVILIIATIDVDAVLIPQQMEGGL